MPGTEMQIVCPNCQTAYEVPDSVFGGKVRKLRCENCGNQWRVGPQGNVPDDLPPALPPAPPPAMPPLSALPPEPPPMAARVFGKPVDAAAQAEFREAMSLEQRQREAAAAAEAQAAADEANTIAGAALGGGTDSYQPGSDDYGSDNDDPFINLVQAARSRAIEFEPEAPPPPRLPITNPLFAGALLTLFAVSVAGLVYLRH